jgi:FkbM family methyltransferase
MKKLFHSFINLLGRKGLLSPFRNLLPHFIYKHLAFKGPFSFKVEGKEIKMIHYGSYLENGLYWEGIQGFEPVSLNLWTQLSKQADVIIDVGANTGVFSLVAGAVNPKARIYAFEPVKRILTKLEKNIDLNGFNIKAYGVALSNKKGQATFYDNAGGDDYSASLNPDMNIKNKIETVIETDTLDNFLEPQLIRPDLVKIDVEKHEAEVIEGFIRSITRYQPTMLIELLTEEIAEKVHEFIKDLPYKYYSISEEQGIKPVDRVHKSPSYNFLICTEEVAKRIGI